MKALRRSIKGEKHEAKVSRISQKSAIAIMPPKKVIRALYDYEAQSSQELSFSKGDFFHVIGRENNTDWYEACNPALPDARGLVPVNYFEPIGKTERSSGQSNISTASTKVIDHDSGYSETSSPGVGAPLLPQDRTSRTPKGTGAMVYGVVLYDFNAERPDELEAKQGEAIIVIAQSTPEWFVAKPIGRLGGPGLIPVSFIEIRDMVTGKAVEDPHEAVQRAGVPKVEEWKKMAADYKNSSIALGKFETSQAQQQAQGGLEQGMGRLSLRNSQGQSQPRSNYQAIYPPTGAGAPYPPTHTQLRSASQLYAPISASIPRYCFAEDKYWFVIECTLEDGRSWELSRYYEDFYDFQIALLTEFPDEAGNTGKQTRTLPYMPGPMTYVTDQITDGRRHNLDAYVRNLLRQPPYISRCGLVKQFFAPREGDFEVDSNANYDDNGSGSRSSGGTPDGAASRQSSRGDLNGGNVNGGGGGYGGLSARPNPPANGAAGVYQSQQAGLRQASSMTQASQTSLPGLNGPGPGTSGTPSAQMKVKIYFGDDLFAIRVPSDILFQQLYEKIRERLKIPEGEGVVLSYKDEGSGERPGLVSQGDLETALGRNEKLVVVVELS